jgi:hypothetical protein
MTLQTEASTLLHTFFSLLSFAFKTQIYEKRIPGILKSLKSSTGVTSEAEKKQQPKEDNIAKIITSLEPSTRHEP